jgi:protein Mpv17
MSHFWYCCLDHALMPLAAPLAPAAIAAKVLLDQCCQTPLGMALFFAIMKLLEGRPQDVAQELQGKVCVGCVAAWGRKPCMEASRPLSPGQARHSHALSILHYRLHCAAQMVPGLVANWKVWVPAQVVNFALIPEEQRILYVNVVGIAWTCIISTIQQQEAGAPVHAQPDSSGEQPALCRVPSQGSGTRAQEGLASRLVLGVPALQLRRTSSSSAAA